MVVLAVASLPMSLIPDEVAPPPAVAKLPCPPPRDEEEMGLSGDHMTETDEVVVSRVISNEDDVEQSTSTSVVDLLDSNDVVVSEYVPEVPSAEVLNNTMSVRQLKERCSQLGLNPIGKKMELAERIAVSAS